ncbi:hypothetical protein FB107DRAFT_280738 [Schizophyllum commune]
MPVASARDRLIAAAVTVMTCHLVCTGSRFRRSARYASVEQRRASSRRRAHQPLTAGMPGAQCHPTGELAHPAVAGGAQPDGQRAREER